MRERRIEKKLPCKITLSVIIGYDEKEKPIKQKLIDVYASVTEVRNDSDTMELYTEFRELITGRIIARSIVDHKYLEFPNFNRYATYTGKLDKTYQILKVGDIDIEFDKGYSLSGLLDRELDPNDDLDRDLAITMAGYYTQMDDDIARYKQEHDEASLNAYFDKLDYTALKIAFPESIIDESKPLEYYNKEEYVFEDNDDLVILKFHASKEIPLFSENYYYEVVTGRKFALECGPGNHMDKDFTFHFDRDFSREILASRVLSEDEIKAYKKEKPKVISKRIDRILENQYAKDRDRLKKIREAG